MNREIAGDEGHRRFLLVRTGSVSCALPTSNVVRVVRQLRCHPVPGSRSHLVGLAQYGGDPLPVLDLHVLVQGDPSNTRHSSTVILGPGQERGHSVLGLAVDEVVRVVSLPRGDSADSDSDFVAERVKVKGEEVRVLNTIKLLREERADSGADDG